MKKIAVIGGGASGMMAAISACGKDTEVTLFEANDRVGKKILVTGNGKCNFTNAFIGSDCYRATDKNYVMHILRNFGRDDCIEFFRKLGMLSTVKRDCYYPASGQANTVLDCLRNELTYKNVKVLTGINVKDIRPEGEGFKVFAMEGEERKFFDFDRVIISVGSVAGTKKNPRDHYSIVGKLGLSMVPVVPSLVQLRCSDSFFKALSGVRFDGKITLYSEGKSIASETGEVQLTDYGISGIPTFQLSRFAAYEILNGNKPTVIIDFLPEITNDELELLIKKRIVRSEEQTAEDYFLGICNKKIMLQIMKIAGIKAAMPASEISEASKIKVANLLKCFEIHVESVNGYDCAQVCAGGVSLEELDDRLMVKSIPGLYLTGEVLDVDGRCGGYNLQWAFSSGYVAGQDAAMR